MAQSAEILEYQGKWPLYGLAWSKRRDKPARLAIGSFVEEYSNKVEIIQHNPDSLTYSATFDHPYPCTKIDWIPDNKGTHPDLIGTTGDFLRLWELDEAGNPKLKCLLNNVRTNKHIAYIT